MSVYYALISSTTKAKIRRLPLFDEPLVFYRSTRNDFENLSNGIEKLGLVLLEAGATELYLPYPDTPTIKSPDQLKEVIRNLISVDMETSAIHLFGSCPLGGDSARFPLDSYGRLISANNIYVNDSSMIPGCTGVNPQGTLMAIAQRNVCYFLEQHRNTHQKT